jgi:hypothetical protein
MKAVSSSTTGSSAWSSRTARSVSSEGLDPGSGSVTSSLASNSRALMMMKQTFSETSTGADLPTRQTSLPTTPRGGTRSQPVLGPLETSGRGQAAQVPRFQRDGPQFAGPRRHYPGRTPRCVGLCGLNEEEVAAISEHEHIPEIAAAALASYLLHPAARRRNHSSQDHRRYSQSVIASSLGARTAMIDLSDLTVGLKGSADLLVGAEYCAPRQ